MNINNTISKNYHEDVIRNFLKNNGHFIFISKDLKGFRTFKDIITNFVAGRSSCAFMTHLLDESGLISKIEKFTSNNQRVMIVITHTKGKQADYIKDIRESFNDDEVIILYMACELEEEQVSQLLGMGINSILIVPYSPHNLIEKISFAIKPSKIKELMDVGKILSAAKRYQEAMIVCDNVLRLKPHSAAALMLKGDIYLSKAEERSADEDAAIRDRDCARYCYMLANTGNDKYLEPLKRLANLYRSENNASESLRYLQEIDELSPFNIDRKMEIGEILIRDFGDTDKAVQYFDKAVALAEKADKEAWKLIGVNKRAAAVLKSVAPASAEKYLMSAALQP